MVTVCPEVLITVACLALLMLVDFTAVSLQGQFTCISPLLVVIVSIYSHFLFFIIRRFIYLQNIDLFHFLVFFSEIFYLPNKLLSSLLESNSSHDLKR